MSNEIIKTSFIQKCMLQYLDQVEALMKASAAKNKVGVTGEGVKSIAYKALQQSGGVMGQLSFKEYLRFIDMGAGRAHPLGGLKSMEVALKANKYVGLAKVKDRVRKPKKIYAKEAYGKLGWLYAKLLYGFSEETIAAIKAELEQSNT